MQTDGPISASLAVDALGLDLREAMALAGEAGFAGIAASHQHQELVDPGFGQTARRHLRHMLQRHHLRLACIRAVSTRGGLLDSKSLDRVMNSAVAAIRMAYDLGAPMVSLYAGTPTTATDLAAAPMEIADTVVEAAQSLAGEADQAGLQLCLSSSSVDFLLLLLGRVGAGHLRANLDTARLGLDAAGLLRAADRLGSRVGIWTLADGMVAGQSFRPVELGRGDLPLAEIMVRTVGCNWCGELIVDVRDLPDPQHAAKAAAEALRSTRL